MTLNKRILPLCKEVIRAYTHHVRDEVRAGREEYIETGIDSSKGEYKKLFLEILGIALGVRDVELEVNKGVKEESVAVVRREIGSRRNKDIVGNYRLLIYTTCELVFDKVLDEIKEEGVS